MVVHFEVTGESRETLDQDRNFLSHPTFTSNCDLANRPAILTQHPVWEALTRLLFSSIFALQHFQRSDGSFASGGWLRLNSGESKPPAIPMLFEVIETWF